MSLSSCQKQFGTYSLLTFGSRVNHRRRYPRTSTCFYHPWQCDTLPKASSSSLSPCRCVSVPGGTDWRGFLQTIKRLASGCDHQRPPPLKCRLTFSFIFCLISFPVKQRFVALSPFNSLELINTVWSNIPVFYWVREVEGFLCCPCCDGAALCW